MSEAAYMDEEMEELPAMANGLQHQSTLADTSDDSFAAANQGHLSANLGSTQLHAFGQLATQFGLDTAHRGSALRLAETHGDESRYLAFCCYTAAIHQEFMLLKKVIVPIVTGSTPVGAQWQPSAELLEYLRRTSQNLLTQNDLEAYTATIDSHKRTLDKSFENVVLQNLRQQCPIWKQRLLPIGFGTSSNPAPARKVVNLVKNRIKHNRDTMRKLLLTQVLDDHRHPPSLPIPVLDNLIAQITMASSPPPFMTYEGALKKIDDQDRMRFAYLRMEALHYYTHPTSNKNTSHWSNIDQKLDVLRNSSSYYQQAFFALVLEQDHDLFGSALALFTDLRTEPDCFKLPHNDDVKVRAAELELRLPA